MTEPFPRRPRVLGSPRSVALAKEGVPPEWEPGCGAPRRRRPVGRERQPGATGHVTSGPGHRTRCGGEPRTFGRAPAAGRDRPVGMEERPSRMRRRVPPVTLGAADIAAAPHVRRREFRCCPISPPARAAPARGARPSRRTPPYRRWVRPRICGGRPKRSTSRMRFGPCLLPCGAPGAVPGGDGSHGQGRGQAGGQRGPGGGDGRDRRASVADVVSPGSFRRGFTGCSGVSVQGRRVT